jgi:3-oxoacyl-[acyl-carrier protein] reductase
MTAGAATAPLPVALITGGTGGLGAAICAGLASAGFRIGVGYHRSAPAAEKLAAQLPGSGHFGIAAPVTDSEALAHMAAGIERRCGPLRRTGQLRRHHAVRAARRSRRARRCAVRSHLRGQCARSVCNGAGAAKPARAQHGCPAVGWWSISPRLPRVTAMGSNVAYCASKAALDNMTRSLARALAPRIRVMSVSPGTGGHRFRQVARSGLARGAGGTHAAAAAWRSRRRWPGRWSPR